MNCIKLSVIVIFIVSMISCKSIVRSINGESKPANVDYLSLETFIKGNKLPIDLTSCLYLKNKDSKLKLSSLRGYDHQYYVAVPNVFVYNANLTLIDDLKLGGCITDRPVVTSNDFYQTLFDQNHDSINFSIEAWKGAFVNYKGETFFPFEKNGKNKVIILWSKYKGNMWAQETNKMISEVKKSNAKIDLYFLNMDEYFIP